MVESCNSGGSSFVWAGAAQRNVHFSSSRPGAYGRRRHCRTGSILQWFYKPGSGKCLTAITSEKMMFYLYLWSAAGGLLVSSDFEVWPWKERGGRQWGAHGAQGQQELALTVTHREAPVLAGGLSHVRFGEHFLSPPSHDHPPSSSHHIWSEFCLPQRWLPVFHGPAHVYCTSSSWTTSAGCSG